MTSRVIVVSGRTDESPFELRGGGGEHTVWTRMSNVTPYLYATQYGDSTGLAVRRAEGAKGEGFIMNLSSGPLQMRYVLEKTGEVVGPQNDFIMPREFKEIGAGPGVIWEIHEAQ